MKCNDFLKVLVDYLEGDASLEIREEMNEHLQWCHDCHVILNTTQKTIEIYHNNEIFELPDGFPGEFRVRLHSFLTSKPKSGSGS